MLTIILLIIAVQLLFAVRVWYYVWHTKLIKPAMELCGSDMWLVTTAWWDMVHLHLPVWLRKIYPRLYRVWLKQQPPWVFLSYRGWWFDPKNNKWLFC